MGRGGGGGGRSSGGSHSHSRSSHGSSHSHSRRGGSGRSYSHSSGGSYRSSHSTYRHHNHHYHSHGGGYYRSSSTTSSFASVIISIAVFVILFAVLFMIFANGRASNIAPSTTQRERVDTKNAYISNCIEDEIGWIDNEKRLSSDLKYFYENLSKGKDITGLLDSFYKKNFKKEIEFEDAVSNDDELLKIIDYFTDSEV